MPIRLIRHDVMDRCAGHLGVMAMFDPPKLPLNHPNRGRTCGDAMRTDNFERLDRGRVVSCDDVQALARQAQAAGWLPEEIAAAMVSLADRYVETRSWATSVASMNSRTGKED